MDLPERNRDGEKKDRTSPSLFVIHNARKACDILFKTGGGRKDIPVWILSGFITSIVRESVRYLVLKIPSIFLGFWV